MQEGIIGYQNKQHPSFVGVFSSSPTPLVSYFMQVETNKLFWSTSWPLSSLHTGEHLYSINGWNQRMAWSISEWGHMLQSTHTSMGWWPLSHAHTHIYTLTHSCQMQLKWLLNSSSVTNTLRNHCPALSCCRSVQLKCEASSVCLPGKTFSTFVVLSKVWSCIRKGTPSTLKIRWRCRLLTCKSSNLSQQRIAARTEMEKWISITSEFIIFLLLAWKNRLR